MSSSLLPGLIRNPFLIDVIVEPGQYPHHLASTCAHNNIATDSVQHIDWLGFPAKAAEQHDVKLLREVQENSC